jgi:hypothetical protein
MAQAKTTLKPKVEPARMAIQIQRLAAGEKVMAASLWSRVEGSLTCSIMECVPLQDAADDLVRRHLADPANGWSVGTWGAIAEFQYDAGELGLAVDRAGLGVSSRRGSLRIRDLQGASIFALVGDDGRTREIAFCSPRRCAGRSVVTPLSDTVFDLGIGAPHVDMLVRVAAGDGATLQALQAGIGRPLLEPGNPAGPAIARASPTRIFVSALATVEVHQLIPPPGGRSPEGPHTHLLPRYLQEGHPHRPGSLLPAGLYCGLTLYPRTRL